MRKWKSIMMVFKEITFYHDLCMKSKPYLLYILYIESNIFCKYSVFYMRNRKRNFSVFYKLTNSVPVPYLMYGIKKNVPFQYFINSVPILYLMYGIKKRTFSVLYKFINPVPVLYLMYRIKNVPF